MSDKEFEITLPKKDFLAIVALLDEFGRMCDERGIRFAKYSEEELLQILKAYRNYRTGDKPPF